MYEKDGVVYRLEVNEIHALLDEYINNYEMRKRATYTARGWVDEGLYEDSIDCARNVTEYVVNFVPHAFFLSRYNDTTSEDERLKVFSAMKDYRNACVVQQLLCPVRGARHALAFTLTANLGKKKVHYRKQGNRRSSECAIPWLTDRVNHLRGRLNKHMLGKGYRSFGGEFEIYGFWEHPLTNIHLHGFILLPDNYDFKNQSLDDVIKRLERFIRKQWRGYYKFSFGDIEIKEADDFEGYASYFTKSADDFRLFKDDGTIDLLEEHVYMNGLPSLYEDKNGAPNMPNRKSKARYKKKG